MPVPTDRCTVVIWLPRRRPGLKPSPEVGMLSSAIEALASVALKTPMTGTVRPLALLSFVTRDQTLSYKTINKINLL